MTSGNAHLQPERSVRGLIYVVVKNSIVVVLIHTQLKVMLLVSVIIGDRLFNIHE